MKLIIIVMLLLSFDLCLAATLKIGLIADTQNQTTNIKSRERYTIFNSKLSDYFLNGAIRPPVSSLVGTASLYYFAEHIAQKNSDVILFLGDLANNGCRDEVAEVLVALRDIRKTTDIPVFVALGNHDYMAAGNISHYGYRIRLCGEDSNTLSKFESMSLFSVFNRESADAHPDFEYADSLTHAPSEHTPQSGCGPKANKTDPKIGYAAQHQRPGCFFSGLVLHHDTQTALVMIDTSDYEDNHSNPMADLGFFGAYGAISKRQLGYLEDLTDRLAGPEYGRTFFSHYNLGFVVSKRKFVLFPELFGNNNTWLSAHTHNNYQDGYLPEKIIKYGEGVTKTIHEVNTGSITDYGMFINIVSVKSDGGSIPLKSKGYRWAVKDDLLLTGEYGLCPEIVDELSNKTGAFTPVMGQDQGMILFGLTRDYRHIKFKPQKDIAAIETNVATLLAAKSGSELRNYKLCLAVIASRLEAGKPATHRFVNDM